MNPKYTIISNCIFNEYDLIIWLKERLIKLY